MRHLRAEEIALIEALARGTVAERQVQSGLPDILVRDLRDGGMGSIRFAGAGIFGCEVAERGYVDSDGVPVSIALNVARDGCLFEIDIFKSDGSPLLRYPAPGDLIMRGQGIG